MAFVRTTLGNPATDAARFLRRLAFIILMIFTPAAELVSHGLIYALFRSARPFSLSRRCSPAARMRRVASLMALKSPVGIAVLFLAFWSALSISWTAFPADAAARLGRTLLTAGLSFVAILVSAPAHQNLEHLSSAHRRCDHGGGRFASGSDRPGLFSRRLYAR